MRAIGGLSAGGRVASLPDWGARPYSVLYMRAQGIGDVILATGVFRAIARSHPTIALDVLTAPKGAPVLDNNPHVRQVLTTDGSVRDAITLAATLRRASYDVIVDGKITRGASFVRSPALAMLARAPYRIGVGGGNHHLVFNVCAPRYDRQSTHMVMGSAALAAPFGVEIESTDFQPEIFLSNDERAWAERAWASAARETATGGTRWLVNLSAGAPVRRWPDERWSALVAHLRVQEPSATIAVMGTDHERASVERVAAASAAFAMRAPRLRDALSLVGATHRVITADTSITHAASAFQAPTVLLLERGQDQWSSWRTPSEVAYWEGDSIASLDVAVARAALDRMRAARP